MARYSGVCLTVLCSSKERIVEGRGEADIIEHFGVVRAESVGNSCQGVVPHMGVWPRQVAGMDELLKVY